MHEYINEILSRRHKQLPNSITSIVSDASPRLYYRAIFAGESLIVMDASEQKSSLDSFIAITKLLQSYEIRVPKLYQQDLTNGLLLLEDLGDVQLLEKLSADNVDMYYKKAMQVLLQFRAIKDTSLIKFDREFIYEELSRCDNWYLGKYLQKNLSKEQSHALKQGYKLLADTALLQPYGFMHRDFHARNLMLLPDETLGVIDFQDALYGPVTYDLVSLLKDCYVIWPRVQVKKWVKYYFAKLQARGELLEVEFLEFLRWFDFIGLQRHIKCLGNFSRLHLQDGKSDYLTDIPQVLVYIKAVCAIYPELTSFGDIF